MALNFDCPNSFGCRTSYHERGAKAGEDRQPLRYLLNGSNERFAVEGSENDTTGNKHIQGQVRIDQLAWVGGSERFHSALKHEKTILE